MIAVVGPPDFANWDTGELASVANSKFSLALQLAMNPSQMPKVHVMFV